MSVLSEEMLWKKENKKVKKNEEWIKVKQKQVGVFEQHHHNIITTEE